jgi:hypothetical protein
MKTLRVSAISFLMLLLASAAFADSINDPKIIIHGVQGGTFVTCPPGGCTDVGTHFSFMSPAKGYGKLFFTNASGVNWTSLKLVETGVPAADISCKQSLFLGCTVETLKSGAVEILLAGTKGTFNPQNGILAGSSFVIDFACNGPGQCWPKGGILFNATANAVPEPATMALMMTGVAAIFSRRKRWKTGR